MADLTDADLDAIEARLDAAERDCPAPWSEDGVVVLLNYLALRFCAPWAVKARDLIAHAPTDLRALLAAVRRGRRIEAERDAGYRLVAKPIPDLHDEGCDGG
jgi:hypothetical protein